MKFQPSTFNLYPLSFNLQPSPPLPVPLIEVIMQLCFKANGKPDLDTMPDWLSVEFSFEAKQLRFYTISVVPWVAEPAMILGTLEIDGSPEEWIIHLESLGFEDVVQVSCFKLFGARADRDR